MKVWINKESIFDNFIVVGDESVVTADLKDAEIDAAKKRILSGERPLNVLLDKATTIPYFMITKIVSEETDTDFEISYKTEKDSDTKTIDAVDIETRKEILRDIESHLDNDFTSMTEEYNVFRAIYASLMTLSGLIIITWLIHGAAASIVEGAEADISGRNSGIKALFVWVLELLGPTGVLIVGALLMFFAVMTLVRRIKQPTIVTTIKKGEQTSGALISTSIKYLIFVGVWYLFGPGMLHSILA